jgi:hypothetical protein
MGADSASEMSVPAAAGRILGVADKHVALVMRQRHMHQGLGLDHNQRLQRRVCRAFQSGVRASGPWSVPSPCLGAGDVSPSGVL